MSNHLGWIVGPAVAVYPDLRFEIAWGPPARGPAFAKTFRLGETTRAADFASRENATGSNVYVGVTLKRPDTPSMGRSAAKHAAYATCLAVDLDGDFIVGARKLANVAKPQVMIITGRTPERRGQLWIGTKPTTDMDLWSEVNRRLVALCGGDEQALGAYRLMRLGGSVSYPSPKKRSRGYVVEKTYMQFVDAPTCDLRDLLNRLRAVEPQNEPANRRDAASCSSAKLALPSNLRDSPPLNRTNVAIVQSMLDALPDTHADNFDLWLRVGFALHEFDGSPIGLALWRQFSMRCPVKAAHTDFDRRWAGFDREFAGRRLGLGWLWLEAQTHGWSAPRRWDRSTKIAS
jgi:hypothetical protein